MTRNDIKALFPEAPKEAIDSLLDINSQDIGRAANKGKDELERLESRVRDLTRETDKLNEQVKTLTGDIASKESTIKALTAEKESALKDLKAQHESEIKALMDKQAGELKDLKGQLKVAEEKAANVDTLNQRVDQLTRDIAARDATIAGNDKQYRIKDELRSLRARNVDVVWPLLDLDKITVNDGKIEGLSEQVEALQQSDSYLFDTPATPQRGGFAPNSEVTNASSQTTGDVVNKAIRLLAGR